MSKKYLLAVDLFTKDDSNELQLEKAPSIELLNKCGEIFKDKLGRAIVYICTQCGKYFRDPNSFSAHVQQEHTQSSVKTLEQQIQQDMSTELKVEPQQEFTSVDVVIDNDIKQVSSQEKQELPVLALDYTEFGVGIEDNSNNVLCSLNSHAKEIKPANFDTTSTATTDLPSPELASDEETTNPIFLCKRCNKEFDLEIDQRQHHCVRSLKSPRPFICAVCGKGFSRKANLNTHEYSHQKVKPFACNRCSATYANKQNLIIHQRRHTGDKPFECEYCLNRFVTSTERNSHMRLHTGERPYVCEECGRGHTTSSQLLEHRRRKHFDIRPQKCENCGKEFRTSANLWAHYEAVHADLPRSHKCENCKSAFKTLSALHAHSKIHGEKRYKCSICHKAFAQHPGLYTHMKTHAKAYAEEEKVTPLFEIEVLNE